jgi:hypothetical protein
MNKTSTFSVIGFLMMTAMASGSVMAQDTQTDVPGHPRVNEVNNRLQNQQTRIQNGVNNGTINAKQESRDETHDANIAQRESADEAKNGGHLTKQETHNLNRSENRNSKHIYKQKH